MEPGGSGWAKAGGNGITVCCLLLVPVIHITPTSTFAAGMDNNILEAYIKQVSPKLTSGDVELVTRWAKSMHLAKGEVLLKEGGFTRNVYLVGSGCLRTWYNKNGVPIYLRFTFEGDYTANLKSVRERCPSEFTIEAGEDTSLWVFNLDDIPAGEGGGPQQAHHFIRRVALRMLLAAEEHSNLFKLYSPAERYHYIEQHNPNLIQRIPLSQLASYLGVARETLSRIRAKQQ